MNFSSTCILIQVSCALIAATVLGCSREQEKPLKNQPATQRKDVSTSIPVPEFRGERAFEHLQRVVSFGPRNPNSPGHQQCLNFLVERLRLLADHVKVESFTHMGYDREILSLQNIIATFDPGNKERILLCTHWDTRPRAERDRNPERWDEPIIGANDGGSGVAILLELASLLHGQKPQIGVDLVFFDGEDYGLEGDVPNYLLGSRHFVLTRASDYIPRFGILIDMVGDAQLEILKEEHSVRFAPDIVDLVWNVAKELGYEQFVDKLGGAIIDDHLPLNEAGVRTIDLIDFAYPDESHMYWHTHEDTADKCSARSLEAVGAVLTHIIYQQPP
jgi:hypothetical protein